MIIGLVEVWSLQERCNRTDLIELFKLVKGFSGTPWNEFFPRSENIVSRGHSWKLLRNHCHCKARLQFFSQRVINRWNSLSQEDVDATSVNAFKGRLERRRRHQMDFLKSDSLQVQLAARLLIYICRRLVTTWGQPKWVQLHLVSYLVSTDPLLWYCGNTPRETYNDLDLKTLAVSPRRGEGRQPLWRSPSPQLPRTAKLWQTALQRKIHKKHIN